MATVYYYQEENKKAENIAAIGNAVSQVVGAYKQRQVDAEARQLMENISKTKTRQEAMQVLGTASPRLLRDERIYGKVQSYLEAFQPGEQALQVFDRETGKIKLMPYKSGTVPTEAEFEANNARLDPFEEFYAKVVNPNAKADPSQMPYSIEPMGKLGSREEALKRAFDFYPQQMRENISVLSAKEAEGERNDLKTNIDLAIKNRTSKIQEERNTLIQEKNQISKDAIDYAQSKAKSTLGKLHEDYVNGNINKAQYQAAVKKNLSDRSYTNAKTKVAIESQDDLLKKRIAIDKMTTVGNILLDNLSQGGAQTGTVGSLVRGYDSVISQAQAAYETLGWKAKPVNDYKWPKSLAGESASTKSLLITLTMARLAAEGQTGRQVSDKDFERFNIGESGSPKQMLDTIRTIISSQQQSYYKEQNTIANAYGLQSENDITHPFEPFGNKVDREKAQRRRQTELKFLVNPSGVSVEQSVEEQVNSILGDVGGLFDPEESEED